MILYLVDEDRLWEVPAGESVIGRGLECALPLDAARYPEISRRHVTLIADGSSLRFRDEGGANGTMKNGVRLSAGELREGDSLQLGAGGPRFEIRRSQGADEITRVSAAPTVRRSAHEATTVMSQAVSGDGATRMMFIEPQAQAGVTRIVAAGVGTFDRNKTTIMGGPGSSASSTAPAADDHGEDDGFVPPPLPDVNLAVGRTAGPDVYALEQKLKTLQSMLAAALVIALLPVGLLIYQARQIDANREAILSLQHQANTSVGLLLPELDARMKHLDDRLDSIDPKLQKAEDRMVERMNREMPAMMDRYMNGRVETLEKTHPELMKQKP